MITKLEYKQPGSFLWVSDEQIGLTDTWLFNNEIIVIPHNRIYDNKISTNMPFKIVAQTNITPEIPNIPIIELPEEEDVLLKQFKEILWGDRIIEDLTLEAMSIGNKLIEMYKAASKEKMFSLYTVKKIAITIYQNLKRGNDFDGLITEVIKLNTPKSNSDIIGCELVMENKCWCMKPERGGYIECNKHPKTYINKSGKTCFEIKFIYK